MEVVPNTPGTSDNAPNLKSTNIRTHRVCSSTEEELILLKEVADWKAHVDIYAYVQKEVDLVAQDINSNPMFRVQVKAHTVQGKL